MMKKLSLVTRLGILLICMWAVSLVGCAKPGPIKIGFSGQLTGAYADLGIKGRDGVMLAVKEINAAGGIAGRPIDLLVRDDLGTPEGARATDQELIDAGVVAIIGHMTSAQTMAAKEVTEEAGVILFSFAASTVELSGLDDHFFRVAPTCSAEALLLARHVYRDRGLVRLAVILDTDNAEYTSAYWNTFSAAYETLGGQVAGEWDFSSSGEPDWSQIVTEMEASSPDALLIIASPLDTALIAQKTRMVDSEIPLFSSAWGQTDELLRYGGRAVEGMEILIGFDSNSQKPAYQEFRSRYLANFGREPTFVGGSGYEAMLVLAAALEKTKGEAEGLEEALLETRDFEGLVGTVSMDEYGDVIRTHFLHTVENGQFITKSLIEP
jgi:branched-chain amino acid transport system substrate-binding protein